MQHETVEVLVVGGGQAGIAMSEHLSAAGIGHLVLERARIAERWRSARWDSLVANGPAWHDRFPGMTYPDCDPESFPPKQAVAAYFEAYAAMIKAPLRCGVEVTSVRRNPAGPGFLAETSQGMVAARAVVAATGPFQTPLIPKLVPAQDGLHQIHSAEYRNPGALPSTPGREGVLVVGAGASGAQIADELQRAGRQVYLSLGPHERPPRRYRGRDLVWWLGVLNKWDAQTHPGAEHTTYAQSGAHGGLTVDFRQMAAQGMVLLGRAEGWSEGRLQLAPDLAQTLARADAGYLALLDEADAFIERNGLDLPPEPGARAIAPDPACVRQPILSLDLAEAGIGTVIWATGFTQDYSWLKLSACDASGRPGHLRGIATEEPGLYFLGLPWQTQRGSAFIWGVWQDAKYLAGHIARQRSYLDYDPRDYAPRVGKAQERSA